MDIADGTEIPDAEGPADGPPDGKPHVATVHPLFVKKIRQALHLTVEPLQL